MISKVLVANRGEIAVRAFRAAYELGVGTVAVYPYEDRNSLHRLKADESYQIGEHRSPGPGLSVASSEIVDTARRAGADAVYPGYGFLSENPQLAAACAKNGITFVGPSAEVLSLTGNKSRAVAAAREAGLPVLTSSAPSSSVDELVRRPAEMDFPLFVKAVAGGGGRGMRRVDRRRRAARSHRGGQPRSRVGVRRSDGLPRTGRAQPAPHRGSDPGRHARQRDPPLTSGTAGAAAPPEGRRAGARPNLPRSCGQDLRRRGGVRPAYRLQLRGHGGIPARRARPARLHRDEPADPGRAHRHRGDHRRRPGLQPDADRGAARPWTTWACGRTSIQIARRGAAVPDHHRGPGQRIPAGHRPDQRLPQPGRCGHPSRRRHDISAQRSAPTSTPCWSS